MIAGAGDCRNDADIIGAVNASSAHTHRQPSPIAGLGDLLRFGPAPIGHDVLARARPPARPARRRRASKPRYGSAIRQAPKRPSVTRAADIEIDFVVAEFLADPGSSCEIARIGAAKLQRDRVLAHVEAEQPRAVATNNGAGDG
ncbi:hypothetical protein CP49_26915 [Bradyrhizobium valentinum]|uniref:Uncharacterized protein n=1 Tax=Bradyrhizobium valentinum TaxID=1518501 RepID=A0A0R3LN11_9BRAD|nr:hypothetical protein CP49_26915 [Bradyrhizobium valentinum]